MSRIPAGAATSSPPRPEPVITITLTAAEAAELGWQDKALCAEVDPELFYPEKGGSTRDPKRICAMCEVREPCLDYALTHEDVGRFGIWGGTSERERRVLRRQAA
jgi:WhiB family redox-sensing transcriptional regulator